MDVPAPRDFAPIEKDAVPESIASWVSAWAIKRPEHPALWDNDRWYSYKQLDESANRVANGLLQLLGAKEEPVVVLMDNEALAIFSILGILKAGKFYAGLEPTNPPAYLETIVEELQPSAVLTSKRYLKIAEKITRAEIQLICVEDWLESDLSKIAPEYKSKLNSLAVIFFTSGSTGRPKGVVVDNQGLWYRTFNSVMTLKFSPSDRSCMTFPVGFSWSTTSMYGTLVTGGTLYLYSYAGKTISDIAAWYLKYKITTATMPAAFLQQFVSHEFDFPSNFPDMRLISTGGAETQVKDAVAWQQRFSANCTLSSGFSSSEAGPIIRAVLKTDSNISSKSLKFGTLVPASEILILDENGNEVAQGDVGEIAIRSKANMVGYWKNEALNKKMFVDDPQYPGNRLLLTGDLGVLNQQGELEYIGRKDTQIKIRGFRVDTTHIETVIRQFSVIEDVFIMPITRKNGELKIAAYLVQKKNQAWSLQEFKRFLVTELPAYAIPTYFCMLDVLPYNATGKVNNKLLPEPRIERKDLVVPYAPPQQGLEMQIATIWQEILEVDLVGVHDNFFDLGGDSLLALQMSLEVEKLTSKIFPLEFFENPTIHHIAQVLQVDTLKTEIENTFTLRSQNKVKTAHSKKRRNYFKIAKLKKLLKNKNTMQHLYRFIDKWIGKRLVAKPYLEAIAWRRKWSKSIFAKNVLYQHRRKLFNDWLTLVSMDKQSVTGSFQLNILNNLYFWMPKSMARNEKHTANKLSYYLKSKHAYWRTQGELLHNISLEEVEKYFPMINLEGLEHAYQQGKGVILLSFHGTPRNELFSLLAKHFNLVSIPTISYQTPLRQSWYDTNRNQLTEEMAFTMNAEIALHGQRILQQGGIVNILSDTNDLSGKTYKICIGKRIYQMKGGFAELALNTGAVIIPYSRYCLPDGRVQTEFHHPMEAGTGERQTRIENMLKQYAAFIEQCWLSHPEAISWARMKNHMGRLPAES